MTYKQLDLDDRIAIRFGLMQKLSLREIARQLNRSPSTISREIRRNWGDAGSYSASDAQACSKSRRADCRPKKKRLFAFKGVGDTGGGWKRSRGS